MEYKPGDIEPKWRSYWKEKEIYKVSNKSQNPKFYVLDMFPYPSGAGLHVGHPLGYIASDIYSRFKRMNGFNVLHPMGFDAFGLPAEQYAIETGIHPAVSTADNIKRYKEQMDNIGFSFDWSREVETCDPKYYKWTQWIFLELYQHYYCQQDNKAKPIADLIKTFEKEGNSKIKAASTQSDQFTATEWKNMNRKTQEEILMNYRLAYRKTGFVNWCEALGTVLANDEVKDGVSERGGHPVIQRPMLQWSLRITAYAERLLNDLDHVEWSEALKTMQRNWIGRSEGAQVFFDIVGHDQQIEIFTTRPDTIFGATYMVLAPEHDLVAKLTTPEQRNEIDAYIKYVNSRSERERMAEVKEVTGAFTGAYAINPLNEMKVPIWIGEYVLKDYGTGAIMAVPSDDERDKAFATKFGLEIIDVVDKTDYPGATLHDKLGKMINSGFINGMEVPEAITATIKHIEALDRGAGKINYKLRDANYSRQRYWGEPFPIIYDNEGIPHMDTNLPLTLPELDEFKPGSGEAPLSLAKDWVHEIDGFARETDTMPGFAGSSWYFLRYMDPDNEDEFASQEALNYWRDVDLYVGGTEHAVGHLMYSRFWHKFLYDKGLVPTKEPFKKLINQGMIQGIIEFVYLIKDQVDSDKRFFSSDLATERFGDNIGEHATKIPVHIDFVQNYGTSESCLNVEGIRKFIEWRPDYKDAIFESKEGQFHNGSFIPVTGASDMRFMTHSEVGKMSKSKYNVINPDDVVADYGADTFRMYEMFLGPIEQSKPWDTNGIDGVYKFIRRFWSLIHKEDGTLNITEEKPSPAALKILHTCIKKVSTDIERFSFNTCVSSFMVCVNDLKKNGASPKAIIEPLTLLLAPFAPHICEEVYSLLGHNESVHLAEYPIFDESHLKEDSVEYPICINGKKRAVHHFATDASKDDIEAIALEIDAIQKWLEGVQ
ncbi:MAG: leucine--tRNA ligase, partial [Bacteroidia bacterium]|nr:leucine--tRNA ligase [Bacteroidia bacterium]